MTFDQLGDIQSQQPAETRHVPSSLWQSAYDHPVTTGLAVGAGLAVAGAALYVSRGRMANIFASHSQEVLVVEAAPFMGRAMKGSLEAAGHKVTLVTEIASLNPLTGTTIDGAEILLNLRRFNTAFVDPNHVHQSAVGFDKLAPLFRNADVRTIGTSVMSATNKDMLANGIDIAGKKQIVVASLVGNKLNLQEAVRTPQQAQQALNLLDAKFNTKEFAELHNRTSELLNKYAGLN